MDTDPPRDTIMLMDQTTKGIDKEEAAKFSVNGDNNGDRQQRYLVLIVDD